MTDVLYTVRAALASDAAAIAAIYNREVLDSTATMDMTPRTLDQQRDWITSRSGAYSAVVAVDDEEGDPIGFASLSPYKERAAYSTTVEDSVYVDPEFAGLGVGRMLLSHIIDVAADSGFHSVIARIAADGLPSRALHEKCGFDLVGVERQVARKFRRWIDVAVYQRML